MGDYRAAYRDAIGWQGGEVGLGVRRKMKEDALNLFRGKLEFVKFDF